MAESLPECVVVNAVEGLLESCECNIKLRVIEFDSDNSRR